MNLYRPREQHTEVTGSPTQRWRTTAFAYAAAHTCTAGASKWIITERADRPMPQTCHPQQPPITPIAQRPHTPHCCSCRMQSTTADLSAEAGPSPTNDFNRFGFRYASQQGPRPPACLQQCTGTDAAAIPHRLSAVCAGLTRSVLCEYSPKRPRNRNCYTSAGPDQTSIVYL